MRRAALILGLILAWPNVSAAQDDDWTSDETWEDPEDEEIDEDVDEEDYWEAGDSGGDSGSTAKKPKRRRRRRRSSSRTARRGPFGLGLIFGDPTGFTGKYFLSGPHSLQGHVGWGFGYQEDGVRFMFDYVYHFLRAIPPLGGTGRLSPTLGIGGELGITNKSDSAFVGVRVPMGLSFAIRPAPVEIFFEIAVGVRFIPHTVHVLVDGGLGARYYF